MGESKNIRIALAGNPNCGKTTIFNNITGARQHVGNYPGVTVERVEGKKVCDGNEFLFIDLPGTYSLTARSMDELVARNVIINESPDVIINVVDASNLERNLYLAAQLIELERPLVIALNMIDIAEKMGYNIDIEKLSENLGASIVATVGRTNKGTGELLKVVGEVAKERKYDQVNVDYGTVIEPMIGEIVGDYNSLGSIHYPVRWLAVKTLENDPDVIQKVKSIEGTAPILEKAEAMRAKIGEVVDIDTVFQEKRHEFAVRAYTASVSDDNLVHETISDKIDKVVTNRVLGLPIFAGIMWILFNLVFTLGSIPQDFIADNLDALGVAMTANMEPGPLQSLIKDGIFGGVGNVLAFLPLILILFLGISFLEDSGYMARAAFVMDRIMRSFGLHGKSFIPMLLGFGCSVPAIMGARILDNPKDRLITIMVTPFSSCNAKNPVYILLIGAFFSASVGGTIMFLVYFGGIFLAALTAKFFRKTLKGEAEPFVMELPPYHLPTPKSVLLLMWERTWMYVRKAGTFILMATIVVWFLVYYPTDVQYSQNFDDARAKVEQTYEMKDKEIVKPLGIDSVDANAELAALVKTMQDQYAAAKEEEPAEEASADEGKSVHDLILAGESNDKGGEIAYPDSFKELETKNPKLYPYAIQIFDNGLAKDDEISALDEQQAAEKIDQSYAARLGKFVLPVFEPLGFDWKIGVGVVTSMVAKEVLVSTMGTIYSVTADPDDSVNLQYTLAKDKTFNPAVALALMAFILVYPPCIAALSVIKKETSWKWFFVIFAYGNVCAWLTAFIVYRVALFFGLGA